MCPPSTEPITPSCHRASPLPPRLTHQRKPRPGGWLRSGRSSRPCRWAAPPLQPPVTPWRRSEESLHVGGFARPVTQGATAVLTGHSPRVTEGPLRRHWIPEQALARLGREATIWTVNDKPLIPRPTAPTPTRPPAQTPQRPDQHGPPPSRARRDRPRSQSHHHIRGGSPTGGTIAATHFREPHHSGLQDPRPGLTGTGSAQRGT